LKTEVRPNIIMEKCILIIDDDPMLRRLLALGLEAAGYTTCAAANGEEAKAVIQAQTPDIIMVDLYMPRMDGLRFLQWLRKEALMTIPAVVFTASGREDLLHEVQEAGATAILRKPIHIPKLLETLASLG
jgi:CheY-like chemotaxis protein